MKTIFSDFDGVLFDSVKEAYLLARFAYYGISPDKPVVQDEYYIFRKYRYLNTHSWQFYYFFLLVYYLF